MKKHLLVFSILFIMVLPVLGQAVSEKLMYFIDSVPVFNDPEPGNELLDADIADMTVIKNRDTLRHLGFDKYDGVIFIFTKEFRMRPDSLKGIPSTYQLEIINDIAYYNNQVYTGRCIDYFHSGRKFAECTFLNGKVDGYKVYYFQNKKIALEKNFTNGIENGIEQGYFENGMLKHKGAFGLGKKEGLWQAFYPNGQVKQESNYLNGKIEGESICFYSNGQIADIDLLNKEKTKKDKHDEKIEKLMVKANSCYQKGDFKNAYQYYSKIIEIEKTFVDAYFSRGLIMLQMNYFEEAISDFDKALMLEPYLEKALENRAFARIKKYQLNNAGKMWIAQKAATTSEPGFYTSAHEDLQLITKDLKQALFLGVKSKELLEAYKEYCMVE